ncbi:hypothetical protein ABTM38_19925, partial [Acinetobacter baumannii]
ECDWQPGSRRMQAVVDGRPLSLLVHRRAEGFRLTHGGAERDIVLRTPDAAALARLMPVKVPPDMSKFLLCPMPGLVVSI